MQNNLFGIPNFKSDKQKEKKLATKAASPAPTSRKSSSASKSTNISEVVEAARRMLQPDERFELVTDVERLSAYMEKVVENGVCALDTETTGLSPVNDYIVGVCLYTPGETAIYVPIAHVNSLGELLAEQLTKQQLVEQLIKGNKVKWIFHNAKFDIRFIRSSLGLRVDAHWDTALAANYLNENESHKLKHLWSKYIAKTEDTAATFDELFHGVRFSQVPLDVAYLYAAGDALKTFELYEFQKPFLTPFFHACEEKGLNDAAEFFHGTDMQLIPILADMEDYGIILDTSLASSLSTEYKSKLDETLKACYDIINELDLHQLPSDKLLKLSNPVNIGSPAQLAILIYDVMGLQGDSRATGEEVLQKYSSHSRYGKFFQCILRYRELSKLLSTYIDKLPATVSSKTGRIHASFNQYGAKTGRFSSSDPNLQNIPTSDKSIRQMFKAADGNVFVSCDYSQQEPRVLAHLSQDERLITAYKENRDLYAWIASEVFKVPYEHCRETFPDGTKNPDGKKKRDAMKSVVLGIMYGRGYTAISEQLAIDKNEARRIVDLFFEGFPKVRQYIDITKHAAKNNGYVQTVWGRKRRLPDLQLPEFHVDKDVEPDIAAYYLNRISGTYFKQKEAIKKEAHAQGVKIHDNGAKIADAERQSINSIIQGTSADITKSAMLLIGKSAEMRDLKAQMILTVHDEIIMECPRENALQVQQLMSELMIKAAASKISVPMKVDSEITEKWYGEPLDLK